MKYFVKSKEIEGTMYWEFFRGSWNADENGWWNEESICLNWDFYSEIEDFIYRIVPTYDHYGETEISQSQWNEIKNLAILKGGLSAAIVAEADGWMTDTFNSHAVFTILGI